MRGLKPHEQVKSLLGGGITLLALSACFTLLWREHSLPSEQSWSRVSASLNSEPETWESDKNLYAFSVKFITAEGKHHRAQIFAEKLYYNTAHLDRNTPLLADIATTEKGIKVKRLLAPNGIFLYDPPMEAHIIKVRNRETTIAVFLSLILGIISVAAAATINHRSKSSQNKTDSK
jgi:hypothetical protein